MLSGKNGLKSMALAGGTALHATNIYLATTILPSVIDDIGGLEFYAWNTTLFMVASIIGSVFSSRLLANYGPKKSYRFASLIFAVGTLICALAPNMPIMLIGRTIQGFGGGVLFALSYAMIRIVFVESLWPRAMALVSGMWGVAALSGPFVGGIFAEIDQWRLAFGILIPLTAGIILLTEKLLPGKDKNEEQKAQSIPWIKLGLLTLASIAVSLGSVFENPIYSIISLVAAFICFIAIIRLEKTSFTRLLPSGAYRISKPLGVLYLVMAVLVIATTVEIYVPYILQIIQGKAPFVAGYLAAFMAIGWTAASFLFSGVKGKTVRTIIFAGPVLMLLSLVGLYTYLPYKSASEGMEFYIICTSLLLLGFGIGMAWPHLLTKVLKSAKNGQEELASSSITTVQLIATSFGAALAGMAANLGGMTEPGGLEGTASATKLLFLIFMIFPAIGFILLILRNRIFKS